jgi:hypothetical protein
MSLRGVGGVASSRFTVRSNFVGSGFAMADFTKITVSKMEVARRQLATAIRLWFEDADPVSIHTLAAAAYEIIHVVSRTRKRTHDLLFDSALIKDEYRAQWNNAIKKPANFFKHANKDANETLEFPINAPWGFILFSIAGVQLSGEKLSPEESAFMFWHYFTAPNFLTEQGRQMVADLLPVEHLEDIRALPKREFFKAFTDAARNARR